MNLMTVPYSLTLVECHDSYTLSGPHGLAKADCEDSYTLSDPQGSFWPAALDCLSLTAPGLPPAAAGAFLPIVLHFSTLRAWSKPSFDDSPTLSDPHGPRAASAQDFVYSSTLWDPQGLAKA